MTTVMELSRQGVAIPLSAWVFVSLYVLAVALSRLYLGVHSTYDIVAGGKRHRFCYSCICNDPTLCFQPLWAGWSSSSCMSTET
jgi:hypothetical protein